MEDGKLRGGDSGMAYVGTYELDGDLFAAQMSVTGIARYRAWSACWATTT